MTLLKTFTITIEYDASSLRMLSSQEMALKTDVFIKNSALPLVLTLFLGVIHVLFTIGFTSEGDHVRWTSDNVEF